MLLPSRKATKALGIHQNTLRRWAKDGKIKHFKTQAGQRLYDVDSLLNNKIKRNFCYCRVSSSKQKDDLERQVEYVKNRYPNHEVITDIGSGINFKRKGLATILELANQGDIGEVVVAHKDRLCRFGFELIEWLINKNGGKLMVLEDVSLSPQEELTQDLLSIIHVFSCRMHGLRKYSFQIKKDTSLSKQKTEKDIKTVDGSS